MRVLVAPLLKGPWNTFLLNEEGHKYSESNELNSEAREWISCLTQSEIANKTLELQRETKCSFYQKFVGQVSESPQDPEEEH